MSSSHPSSSSKLSRCGPTSEACQEQGRVREVPVMGKGTGVPEISKACTLAQEEGFDSKKPI